MTQPEIVRMSTMRAGHQFRFSRHSHNKSRGVWVYCCPSSEGHCYGPDAQSAAYYVPGNPLVELLITPDPLDAALDACDGDLDLTG